MGRNEFQGTAALKLSETVYYLSRLWQNSKNISLFFQIAELKEPCRDLRDAFLSTCLSISIVQHYE